MKTVRLRDVGTISGSGVDKKTRAGEVPVRLLNYLDVYHKAIIRSRDLTMATSCKVAHLRRFQIRRGDIFFTPSSEIRNDIGRAAVAIEDIPDGVYSYHVVRLRPRDGSVLDPNFAAYAFSSADFLAQASRLCEGSGTRYVISLRKFRSMTIALPQTVDEQQAVAIMLSDIDSAIESLQRLIHKKKDTRRSVMHSLLIGTTRLRGFYQEWKTVRLRDVGVLTKGRGIMRGDVAQEGYPCVRYGELYTRYTNYVTDLAERIPPEQARVALPIARGDLLFAASGETAEEIGRCVAYLGQTQAYAGGDIVVLTPHADVCPLFLGCLMNHATIVSQKAAMAQGNAVVHIGAQHIGSISCRLPAVSEQREIADILVNVDDEITVLQEQRDKMIAIKHAMMQMLLTGRIRLADREAVSAADAP